jgi:CTP:molybdopterin cytidylyltransferase MocA
MTALIVIPARMQATRLPGKPLADINGVPMIVHVWRRAVASGVGDVAVATDEPAIARAVEAAGGVAVMTRADHPSGSDRIFEAITKLDPKGRHDIIVNLQGDLPTLDPALVAACAAPLADAAVDIATLAAVIQIDEERRNPNVVKLVGTPVGADGHSGMVADMDTWVPLVEAYLAQAGFTRSGLVTRPAASSSSMCRWSMQMKWTAPSRETRAIEPHQDFRSRANSSSSSFR